MNLTKPQKLIYDMEKYAGGAISVICGGMLIRGKRGTTEIQAAVNELYRLNDALRIRISETDGTVSQKIMEYAEQNIPVLRFESKAEMDSYAEKYVKTPLDFYGNLCEISVVVLPEQYGLLVKLHHIIGDAWSLSLLGTQFNKLLNGDFFEAYSYADYVQTEEKYIQSKRYERDKNFFVEQFKKCDEATYINEKQSDSLNAKRKTFAIDNAHANLINSFAEKNETSAFMLFTVALSAYMNRTKMNAEKFYIGTAVLNRSGNKEQNTVGMFINTVPMLIELDNEKSFSENLSSVEETALSVFRHERYNYGDVLTNLRKEFNFGEKLYDTMISYQNAKVRGADVETTWYHGGEQSESLQIHIDDRDSEGIFRVHYDYLTEKFTGDEIEKIHRHICNLLFDGIANPNKKLHELNILTPEEQQKLLYTFNDTAVEYPKDKCVHQLFEEQVKRTPDKTAIIFKDTVLSYFELNELVQKYADILVSLGINKGNVVAVHLERSHRLIVLQLAVLKIGAIFLPVDKRYPIDRIEYMCKDCNVSILVSDDSDDRHIKANVITIDEFEQAVPNKKAATVNNSGICYIIYTSGSTGTPKGCALTGKGLTNFCRNNNTLETLKNRENNVFACVNSVSFDYFIAESLLPLTNGYTTVIFDDNESTIQDEFLKIVSENAVNVVMTTPTRLKIYFSDKSDCDVLKQLICVCTSGEPLMPELLMQIYEKSPNAQVYNPIGPSECSVWDIGGRLNKDDGIDIHIGKPIANTQIYIVDKYMKICPIGVTGELCIAGDGVGAGYLNRPELTAEKFIDNPFGKGKLYKTGDLAYWREDGNIAYVGRNDFQVKIRGLRIELGEIENAINSVDGISQSVVVVRKDEAGRQLICAFYTGEEKPAKVIRDTIGKRLPKYMLPHIFTHIVEMPLTSSGKVNRKALPEIDLNCIYRDAEHVAPKTQLEKELCGLMKIVLGLDSVGITDNFFDFGGDSLKAIEFVSKAHNEGIYFSLQNVFDYPTVKSLCNFIQGEEVQNVSFADVDFSRINKILEKNSTEFLKAPQKCNVGNILLAGATGFLGIHILADYLDKDSGTAYCLVRGKDNNDSINRLRELLQFYFGDKYAETDRIEVICADLQKDKFGLQDSEYFALAQKVDFVINCAASVKHYGSYKYFYEVNVESVKRLIDFCKYANAKLIHTSTLSVSGNSFGDEFDGYISGEEKHFYESSLYIGQPLDNVYARSKFEAEKAVLDAMADGLNANIMRMGFLANRYSDGKFQKNYESNAFLQRIKGIIELGKVPDYLIKNNLYSEFTPIDEAASAVMTIARHFSAKQTVFHINSTKVVYLGELLQMFNELGFELKIVDGPEFTKALRRTVDKYETEHIFETFINDIDENDQLCYESNIYIENDFTVQYLKLLGFEWSDIDITYIQKYVQYFKRIGYFNEKRLPIL